MYPLVTSGQNFVVVHSSALHVAFVLVLMLFVISFVHLSRSTLIGFDDLLFLIKTFLPSSDL